MVMTQELPQTTQKFQRAYGSKEMNARNFYIVAPVRPDPTVRKRSTQLGFGPYATKTRREAHENGRHFIRPAAAKVLKVGHGSGNVCCKTMLPLDVDPSNTVIVAVENFTSVIVASQLLFGHPAALGVG
jgi:hypothetical protein